MHWWHGQEVARGLWVGGVSVCSWRIRDVIDVKVDTQGGGLVEDVTDLRFDLGVKSNASEAELVLVVLRMLNSWSCTKARWAWKNTMRTNQDSSLRRGRTATRHVIGPNQSMRLGASSRTFYNWWTSLKLRSRFFVVEHQSVSVSTWKVLRRVTRLDQFHLLLHLIPFVCHLWSHWQLSHQWTYLNPEGYRVKNVKSKTGGSTDWVECVFIITGKAKTSRGGGKKVSVLWKTKR